MIFLPRQHSKESQMKNIKAFNYYEKRFAKAVLEMPELNPLEKNDKEKIIAIVKDCLGVRDDWIPEIKSNIVKTVKREKYSIEFLTFISWEGISGAAHLYIPDAQNSPKPFVLLCCGHGPNGKLSPGYQAMAARLARQGAIVLVPDNIGQGERKAMGHKDVIMPFACGISFQGLIVMETLGLLNWAENDPRIDNSKMAAIGNSGGGKLTLFLAALAKNLSVLSSSGYPSTFNFMAQKEKQHCKCNIVPNIVGQLEMCHIYGTFAPKPLFVFQGKNDNLFPDDIFCKISRQISDFYKEANAHENFETATYPGGHPWDNERRYALSDFLSRRLGIAPAETLEDDLTDTLDDNDTCFEKWPQNALSADELAKKLTGKNPPPEIKFHEIFPPQTEFDPEEKSALRADDLTILSQFEAFLN